MRGTIDKNLAPDWGVPSIMAVTFLLLAFFCYCAYRNWSTYCQFFYVLNISIGIILLATSLYYLKWLKFNYLSDLTLSGRLRSLKKLSFGLEVSSKLAFNAPSTSIKRCKICTLDELATLPLNDSSNEDTEASLGLSIFRFRRIGCFNDVSNNGRAHEYMLFL